MAHSEKFDHFSMYAVALNVDDSRRSEFGYLPKALISAILVIEILCIVQFWPA